jgi:hypothetical protein
MSSYRRRRRTVAPRFNNQYSWQPRFDEGSVVLRRGFGAASFTRATTRTIPWDFEGKPQNLLSGEVAFPGMRRVYNRAGNSENLTLTPWATSNSGSGTAATCTSGFTAPDGTNTAFRIQADRVGALVTDWSYWAQTFSLPVGTVFRATVWMKSNTGATQNVALRLSSGGGSAVNVTTEWQRFTYSSTFVGASELWGIGTRGTIASTQAVDVLVWHPMYEVLDGQSNQNPSEYVSVGAAKLNELVETENFGSALWLKQNSATATSNVALAPNGTMTASRITNGGLANGAVYQAVTGVVGERYSSTIAFLADTTNVNDFGLYDVTAVAWLGVTPRVVSGPGTVSLVGNIIRVSNLSPTEWTVVEFITNAALANASLRYTAGYPGGTSSTAGFSIFVATPQFNRGATPNGYFPVGNVYPFHGACVDGVKYFNTTNGNTVSSNVVTEAVGTAIPSRQPTPAIRTQQGTLKADWTVANATIVHPISAAGSAVTVTPGANGSAGYTTLSCTNLAGSMGCTWDASFNLSDSDRITIELGFPVPIANKAVRLILASDALSFSFVNYAQVYISTGGLQPNKRQSFTFLKSDFTIAGAFDWANVLHVELFVDNLTAVANATDSIQLYKLWVGRKTKPAVVLSFDDASSSQYTEAFLGTNNGGRGLPYYGIKGTVYCSGSTIGTGGYMSLAQLQAVYAAGWDVGNQGWAEAPFSQQVAISWAAGVATVTASTAHGYGGGASVTIEGADPIELNGTKVAGGVTATTFTFATALGGSGTALGFITIPQGTHATHLTNATQHQTWQRANGMQRGSDHYAYSQGAHNDAAARDLRNLGFKTARTTRRLNDATTPASIQQALLNLTDTSAGETTDLMRLWCIELNPTVSVTKVLATAQYAIDRGYSIHIYCHGLSTAPAGSDYSVTDFFTIIAALKTAIDAGTIEALTISEWYTKVRAEWYPRGYLPEEATTNLVLQSENFGTTWTTTGAPTRSAAAKRCGSVVLDLLGDAAPALADRYNQTITFTGDAVKAISFYFAQGTSTSSVVNVLDNTAGASRLVAVITWSNGIPTVTVTSGTLLGLDPQGDGTWRARVATTAITAANVNILRFFPASDSILSAANTGDAYFGGVQAENKTFCTSYVPTTTATVTRNADVLIYPSAGSANGTTGAAYAEVFFPSGTTPASNNRYILDFNSAGNAPVLYRDTATSRIALFDGTAVRNVAGITVAENTSAKVASSWQGAVSALAVNGSVGAAGFDGDMNLATNMGIGTYSAGTGTANGLIQDARIWTRAATNTQLEDLTA